MVASVSALSLGQEEYHLGLAREDYYTSGGEPPGRWHGRGCAALGVVGEVHGPKLSLLLRGFSADGSAALVQNAGSPARQPGWDVTFSAPKTVSVLWGLADADTRRAVQEAHDRAVAAALDYLEDEAGVTRRGACGAGRERAGLAVAVFQHGTSRSQDPQLHSHCLILNLGVREDGSTGTIESRPLYRHKMAAGAVYRAALAAELERGLGVVAERRKGWFEVAGVPAELAEALSQRRREIEAVLAERGLEGAKSAALAALETRSRKSVLPRAELFLRWAEVGAAHGFGPDQARELLGRSTDREPASELREVLTLAVERLTAHHSHFAAADLVRFAAEEAQGRGLDAGQIRRGVDGLLREELVRVGFARGEERYTTREMLALERSLLDQVGRAAAGGRHAVAADVVADVVAARPDLTAEQVAAVRHVTGQAGGVSVLTGLAGTGKTFVLDAAVEAWRRAGRTVLGCALSGKAAQGLAVATGIPAATLHATLSAIESGRLAIGPETVVLVDEAGMVGTRMLERLVRAVVTDGQGRLVLVGDHRQIQPVEAGGPFAAIARLVGQAELTQITRQAEPWFREAVRHFAEGDVAEAVAPFVERGWVHVAENVPAARQALVASWAAAGGVDEPRDHLILAGTNAEVRTLNRLAQAEREKAGKLHGEGILVNGDVIRPGDRLLFTRNDRLLGVKNGHLGEVIAVNADTRTLTVRLDGGGHVLVDPEAYPHIQLGLAVTTYKAQGMTVDHVYALLGDGVIDRELSYTQASRARSTARFYTTEEVAGEGLTELIRQMSRSNQKDLACDLLQREPELSLSVQG